MGPEDHVPTELLERALCALFASESPRLLDSDDGSIQHDGISASLSRAVVRWRSGDSSADRTTEFIVKRWRRGGNTENWIRITKPLEALGWQAGLLRREAMPQGIVAPILAAWSDNSATEAWVVMEDISATLNEFRMPRQWMPDEVASPAYTLDETWRRTAYVLDGVARLHVAWEGPERRPLLDSCDFLTPHRVAMEGLLPSYRWAFGLDREWTRTPNPPEWLRANANAFLERVSSGDRGIWAELICDRSPFVDALVSEPVTLLHGDLDFRNVGLRWEDDGASVSLIDWECLGVGSLVLDATKACYHALPISQGAWIDRVKERYFQAYVANGGKAYSHDAYDRAFEIAFASHGVIWFPTHAGTHIRRGAESLLWIDRAIERMTAAMKTLL
ncbi:hypothetical protein FJZ36_07330 [Candidatus Poribacteria bacterium]|nr:hypothetical protein [Candidatus Poribacteria bacterium]